DRFFLTIVFACPIQKIRRQQWFLHDVGTQRLTMQNDYRLCIEDMDERRSGVYALAEKIKRSVTHCDVCVLIFVSNFTIWVVEYGRSMRLDDDSLFLQKVCVFGGWLSNSSTKGIETTTSGSAIKVLGTGHENEVSIPAW